MALTTLDWVVVGVYGAIVLAIGFGFARRAGGSVEDYFIAGRSLPWWLAGTSIAATWFATDAPLATAALVRRQGVYGNWLWWYEAAGILMLTFFYARLWRRAGVLTDAEVIEIRYGGAPARALRTFSAVYQGLLKNAVVMGWVMLAMVKFSRVLLGWDPAVTLAVCVGLALAYTVASGLWGVVVTDLLQFVAGMLGAITLAGIVLTRFGGPAAMADAVRDVPQAPPGALDLVPSAGTASSLEIVSFICLIGILWLRSGQGDGYVAQRLFATRDERQAVKASLWFAFAGTVLLTWPWIVVGLGSLLVFPPTAMDPALAADPELAYPMMIRELMPAGLRGLMVATFLAAFMSTMDTHLCWGASYMVNDVYRRFLRSEPLRAALCRGVADHGCAARGGRRGRGLADGLDPARVDLHHRTHGRGRARLAPALVLVAGERVGRDRRHGGLGAPGQRAPPGRGPRVRPPRRGDPGRGWLLRAGDGPHPGGGHPRRLHRALARRRARHASRAGRSAGPFLPARAPRRLVAPGGGAHRRPLVRPAREPHVAGLPARRPLRLREPARHRLRAHGPPRRGRAPDRRVSCGRGHHGAHRARGHARSACHTLRRLRHERPAQDRPRRRRQPRVRSRLDPRRPPQ